MENLEVKSKSRARIAIFGATSVLAQDFIGLADRSKFDFVLFSRGQSGDSGTSDDLHSYEDFHALGSYEAIINFVGFGSPKRALQERATISEVTRKFDDFALGYLDRNPNCKYIFISSGAVYTLIDQCPSRTPKRSSLEVTADAELYAKAKLEAEIRHRDLGTLNIFDVRVFNYVSPRQSVDDGYFFTDLVRALVNGEEFVTTSEDFVRDFSGAQNLTTLLTALLELNGNAPVDLYTSKSISKWDLLGWVTSRYGLRVCVDPSENLVSPTGVKREYVPRLKTGSDFGYEPSGDSLSNIEQVIQSFGIIPR